MRQVIAFTIASLLFWAWPRCSAAQGQEEIAPGHRVRVELASWGGEKAEGMFQSVSAGLLRFSLEGAAEPLEVPLMEVVELETLVGTRRNTLKGFAIGGLAGATMGAIIGLTSGDDSSDCWLLCYTAEEKALMGGVVLGVAGGVTGLIIGALTKTDEWREVRLTSAEPRFRVGGTGRLEFGFAVPTGR